MNIVTKSRVFYNRSQKQWECHNGKVTTYPAGKEGKREALQEALRSDWPELHKIVADIAAREDNPEVTDRLLRASSLLAKGHVYSDNKVKSQEGEEVYRIFYGGMPKHWACTCEDHSRGVARAQGHSKWGAPETSYGVMCKHTWALLLGWLSNQDLEEEPIPYA